MWEPRRSTAGTQTITEGRVNYPFSGVRAGFNMSMNRPKHLALATAAADAEAAPVHISVTPRSDNDDPPWHSQARATDGCVAPLEEELVKLRKRCRARELALERMARAVATLRVANRALNDENGLLRQQVAELHEQASSRRMARGTRLLASGGT